MDKIKAHYDRFLLILAGIILAGVSILVVVAAGDLGNQFGAPPASNGGSPFAAEAALGQLRSDSALMEKKQAWQASDGSLFVSRVYLLSDGKLVDILESGTELFPGIANSWILEHNLDYTSTTLPDNDPDEDGFSNREEFEGKTNPRDPSSKPALWTKLRLVGSKIDKLRVKFMSLPTGSTEEVSINTISAENPTQLSGSTRFYRENDPIVLAGRGPDGKELDQPTPLKFERAEMRTRFNPTTNVEEEVPVAFLRNTADGREIELQRGEVKDSPYSLATLVDTRSGGQTYELRSGETLELGDSTTYKLVDVSEQKAMIENLRTGERHEIPFQVAAPPLEVQPETYSP
jgi:hypothetical protein